MNLKAIGIWLTALLPSLYFFFQRRTFLGDPIVDLGSELYLGWRLGSGDRLYFDYFYNYGPIAPYLEALGFAVFGASWGLMVASGLCVYLLILFLIGKISLKIFDLTTALACVLFTTFLFAFNQSNLIGNYNYLTPYRLDLPVALLFSLASLSLFFSGKEGEKNATYALSSGVFAAFCFFAKAEIFLALFGSFVTYGIWKHFIQRPNFVAFKSLYWRVFYGFVIGFASTLLLFSAIWKVTIRDAALALISPYLMLAPATRIHTPFYQVVVGLRDGNLGWNFFQLGVGFLCLIVIPYLGLRKGNLQKRSQVILLNALAVSVFALCYLQPGFAEKLLSWEKLTPFLCLIGALIVARKSGRCEGDKDACFLGFVFGFFASLRVLFSAWSVHYGFVLALPSCLVVFAIAFNAFREKELRSLWRIYLILLLIPQVLLVQKVTTSFMDKKTLETLWPEARFHYYPSWGSPLLALDKYLQIEHSLAQTFTVFPEGLFFNFLQKKISPFPLLSLTPDQYELFGEGNIKKALEKGNPDLIVIYPRQVGEFGMGEFTSGYGKEVYNWILGNYLPDVALPEQMRNQKIEIFLSHGYAKVHPKNGK